MSGIKLTLRPPPNVDYVQGYPGIPPSQDRPQAAVKGAIEVRTPPAGVKAQWVRIELRKVETLPGGGDKNTFYDYVGPSPVTLWTAPDGFNILRTQDFPFSIRIPESIPPSVALENRAGIQYELVATVCTKGKRGFFRKRKHIVTKEIAPIVIDKHELHSTWPVYCQPEKRQLAQEGVTLIVERRHACHGPGDRITVMATLRSDNLHTVILQGFEMVLRETTIFRAQTYTAVRKAAPLVRVASIGETKMTIGASLYGGTTHQAELSCQLPHNHTTTTLNAARHIDVTYVLCVKALMGTGMQLSMELPVIISNWQRYVSQEAIRRIGGTSALCLTPSSAPPIMSIEPTSPTRVQKPAMTTTLPSATHVRTPSNSQFNTVPASKTSGSPGTADVSFAEEFGYGIGHRKLSQRRTTNTKGYPNDPTTRRPTVTNSNSSIASTARRSISAVASNAPSRYTITNTEPDLPEEQLPNKISANVVPPTRTTSTGTLHRMPTAEEEKRVYESAKSRVEKAQGVLAPYPPPVPVITSPPSGHAKQWLSAAEEKALLYDKAQAAVTQAQRQGPDVVRSSTSGPGSQNSKPSASEMYRQAMANVSTNRNQPPSSHIMSDPSQKQPTSSSQIPQYLTAEQEKAALKRYEEARSAVDRLQNQPIAYDSLYPKVGGASSSVSSPDAPPSFEASVSSVAVALSSMTAAQEKAVLAERMRAADNQHSTQPSTLPPSFSYAAISPSASSSGNPLPQKEYMEAAAEKEAMRKKMEARDASRKKSSGMAMPSGNASFTTGTRPTPTPPPMSPPISNATAVMSAAEEKALLKAKLEAKASKREPFTHQQQVPQPYSPGMVPVLSPATEAPPPLMPRPPAAYIQETREEDERVSKIAIDGANLRFDADGSEGGSVHTNGHVQGQGQSRVLRVPGSPPPLPPKPTSE